MRSSLSFGSLSVLSIFGLMGGSWMCSEILEVRDCSYSVLFIKLYIWDGIINLYPDSEKGSRVWGCGLLPWRFCRSLSSWFFGTLPGSWAISYGTMIIRWVFWPRDVGLWSGRACFCCWSVRWIFLCFSVAFSACLWRLRTFGDFGLVFQGFIFVLFASWPIL